MLSTPKIIVAGIGTDVGKTIASSILCQALGADYWKPIQCGNLNNSDRDTIQSLVEKDIEIHPEKLCLEQPISPHAAATLEHRYIALKDLTIPKTDRLIIELAGGLMVPLSEDVLNIDWVISTQLPIVLVVNYYLGSINHTLLSLDVIKSKEIPCIGIIFNGEKEPSTFDVIMKRTDIPCLLEINQETSLTPSVIDSYAQRLTH